MHTQHSVAPRRNAELTLTREATQVSNDVRAARDEARQSSSKRSPERRPRADSVNVVAPHASDDRKRQIMLAAAVVVLVVLSFFAGRL